jgi:hypothetical protein
VKLQKAAEGFFVNKTFYRRLKMKGERLVYVVQEYEQQKILIRGGMSAVSYVGVGRSIGVVCARRAVGLEQLGNN